jgi:hypothetical protein
MGQTLRYLEPREVRAWQPEGAAHLRVEIDGDRTILAARLKRAFPLSEPSQLVSIQDGAGKEVAILRTLDGLDPRTRELFDSQLDRRYFTPRIEAIETLKMEAGMWRFVVQTQRGPTEFYVRNWRDSANEIAPGRWQIHSVDGGRFEIQNLEALDANSRRLMDQLL